MVAILWCSLGSSNSNNNNKYRVVSVNTEKVAGNTLYEDKGKML